MQWCLACGAEHVDWAEVCAHCFSPLTDRPLPEPAALDHSIGQVDVSGLAPDQRSRLAMILQSRELPFELVGDVLLVPAAHRVDADLVVAEIDDDAHVPHDLPPLDSGPASSVPSADRLDRAGAVPVATTWRRVSAELVGGLMWSPVLIMFGLVGNGIGIDTGAWWTWTLLVVGTNLTLVSRFGWDPGKRVFGLRVIGADGSWPVWGRSAIRSLVLIGPYVALGFAANEIWPWNRTVGQVVSWAPATWIALVVWSIYSHPERQGWHDRIARTWVVDVSQRPQG